MLKRILTVSLASGVLVMALLATPKPIIEPTPQAIPTPTVVLSHVSEVPTAKAQEVSTPITKSILSPLQAPTEEEMIRATEESVITKNPIISSQDSTVKATTPNTLKIANEKSQVVEPIKSSNSIDTTNLKIGDKVWVEGFGYVEYGGPNTYSESKADPEHADWNKMVGNMGGDAPVTKSKPKEPVIEYVPQAGDIQTDVQAATKSVYVEGQGFVPMNESEDENNG